MRIIFMGTPEFAIPILERLIHSRHKLIAVYTKPSKPAGRGLAEMKSPIHRLAELHGVEVFTPHTFKITENIDRFISLKADIAIIAAYGLILRKEILEGTELGCINVHPSRLPRWRGAAPIQHTIMAGDKETSVCIMKMDEGLDTGDILLRRDFEIPDTMTAYELHNKTASIGSDMVIETLDKLISNSVNPTKQSTEGITYARKIIKEDEIIDWLESAFSINCKIRAMTPKPGMYFRYNGESIKIISAEVIGNPMEFSKSGLIIDDSLSIACGEGILRPKLLQREGRKMLYTEAFLRGFPINQGSTLS
jgi:methionyl-tRNA formyltransferase